MQHFFQEQQARRRATRLLVLLFLIAVGLIVALTQWFFGLLFDARIAQNLNLILYQGWDTFRAQNPYQIHWLSLFISVALILLAALYKLKQLRVGGHVIALQLGGQLVQPNTYHPLERQLLNVVEEMAIAARTPCPRVYLLLGQSQVNAFAAGHTSQNAVIAVTRGALEKLTRDELQAVVAHEFSHLVNGDIRLNNLLVSLTFSISFIGLLGEILVQASMQKSSRNLNKQNAGAGAILGVGLICYGFLGTLMADFIKAAVCRHREYLADACATQFNRNPQALANALKVVAGIKSSSKPRNYHQYSHLFFASLSRPWFNWFATHPPIVARIQKLEPHWQAPKSFDTRTSFHNYQALQLSATRIDTHSAHAATATAGARHDTLVEFGISPWLCQQVHEPQNISYPILALLMSPDAQTATKQLQRVAQFEQFDVVNFDHTEQQIQGLSIDQRFKLLTTACNALHCLPPHQQQQLTKRATMLYEAIPAQLDARHLVNFATFTLLNAQLVEKSALKAHFAKRDLINAWHYLIAVMAHMGSEATALDAFIATCNAFNMPVCQLNEQSAYNFNQAVVHLAVIATLPTKNKSAFLQALEFCAGFDHHLNDDEKTILYMLSASLELPILD